MNSLARKRNLEFCYRPFEIAARDLHRFFDAFRLLPISGCNVTTPHKQAVLPFCDRVSEEVHILGAANVLANREGTIEAFNTDVDGFCDGLAFAGYTVPDVARRGVLILGAGGAARAAFWALWKQGARRFFVAFRSPERVAEWRKDFSHFWRQCDIQTLPLQETELASIVSDVSLIVQCTPVGMWPNVQEVVPFPFETLSAEHLVYDLVYNPPETRFLRLASQAGAQTLNGLPMLAGQAVKTLNIWGYRTDFEEMMTLLTERINLQANHP